MAAKTTEFLITKSNIQN